MPPDQLWSSARRILGVYFLIEGALHIPAAIMPLGYEAGGLPRWPLVLATLGQAGIALAAGWWLVRAPAPAPSDPTMDLKQEFIAPALVLMGVYLGVSGLAVLATETVNAYWFREAWQLRTGNLAGAAVTTAAGGLLITRPALIARLVRSAGRLSA
jgi:hypothetical protein